MGRLEHYASIEEFNNFKVGEPVKRISSVNRGDLPEGYVTTLIEIRRTRDDKINLVIKDKRGKVRPYCSLDSWEPVSKEITKFTENQKAKRVGHIFNSEGKCVKVVYFNKKKEIRKIMKLAKYAGTEVRIFQIESVMFQDIPIAEIKKER